MDESLKKYEELYALSKEGLAEELDRFKKIDDKASRYLTFASFFIVVLGLAGKPVADLALRSGSLPFWILSLATLAFMMSTLLAVWHLFSTFRIHSLKKFPMSDELVEFFDTNTYLNIIYALTRGNIQATLENRQVNDEKAFQLRRAYILLLVSIVSLSVLALMVFLLALLRQLGLELG